MELYEKYNIVLKDKQRYYVESLTERDYNLECSTPYYFSHNTKVLKEKSWVGLITKIVNYLQTNYPIDDNTLLDYRTNWSKSDIFSIEKRTNFVEISNGMFVNVNHTAVHSVWLIQDLLVLYKINKNNCSLVIKRPPFCEPKEITDYVEKDMKLGFEKFLVNEKKITKERATKIANNICILNKYLARMSKAYNNFYLFDNLQYLSNYKSKFFKDLPKYTSFNEKQIKLCHEYLDYLSEYFYNVYR